MRIYGTSPLPRSLPRSNRRAAAAALCLSTLLAPGLFAATDALPAAEQRRLADALLARGMYDLAIREYTNLLQRSDLTDRATVLFRLAEALRRSGRWEEAAKHYRQVLQEQETSPLAAQALVQLGWCRLQMGRPAEAMEPLQRVLSWSNAPPEQAAAARFYAALAAEQQGSRERSARLLEEIIQKFPGTPAAVPAALQLDEAAADGRWHADRAALLDFVLRSTNTPRRLRAEALLRRGELAFNEGRYADCIRTLRDLRRRFPELEQARTAALTLAWALYRTGDYSGAAALAGTILDEETNAARRAEWIYLQANTQRQLGRMEAARRSYRRLLQKYPSSAFADAARVELAGMLEAEGQYGEALRLLQDHVPGGELKDRALWIVASACQGLGHTAEADDTYQRLIDECPASPLAAAALFRRAELAREAGQPVEAARLFLTFARRYPTNETAAAALWNAAAAWTEAGREEEAEQAYARLLERFPGSSLHAGSLYRKALIHCRRREWAEAQEALSRLLQRFPDFTHRAEALYWLGVSAENRDDVGGAEQAYRRLLEGEGAPARELECRARLRLAGLLRQQGEPEAAAEVLRPLLEESCPGDATATACLWLAHHEFSAGRWSNSWRAAGVALGSTNPVVRQQAAYYGGAAASRLRRYEEAAARLKQALGPDRTLPEAAHAALELGDVELARGRLEEAAEAYREAAELGSEQEYTDVQLRAWYSLARLEESRGRTDEALRLYTACGILFDDPAVVPECMFRAASLLSAAGRQQEAEELAEELKRRYPASPWAQRLPGGVATEGSNP